MYYKILLFFWFFFSQPFKDAKTIFWLLYPIKAGGGPDLAYWFANIICYLPAGAPSLVGGIYIDNYSVLWKDLQWRLTWGPPLRASRRPWEELRCVRRGAGREGILDFVLWLQDLVGCCLKAVPTWTQVFPLLTGLGFHLESLFWCYYFPLGSLPCFCGLYPCSPQFTVWALTLMYHPGSCSLLEIEQVFPSSWVPSASLRQGWYFCTHWTPGSLSFWYSLEELHTVVCWCQRKLVCDIQRTHLIPNEFSDVWLVAWNLLWWEYSPHRNWQRKSANTNQRSPLPFPLWPFLPWWTGLPLLMCPGKIIC